MCPWTGYWSYAELPNSNSAYCFTVGQPMSFLEAQGFCHSHQAEILALGVPDYLRVPSGNLLLDVLRSTGIESTWYGFYTQNDKLRQDRFPLPPTHNDLTYADGVNYQTRWDLNEPRGSSECFKADLGCPLSDGKVPVDYNSESPPPYTTSSSPAQVKRSVDDVIRRRLQEPRARNRPRDKRGVLGEVGQFSCEGSEPRILSHPCSDPQPFVCVKPALDRSQTSPNSSVFLGPVETICGSDEFGSYQLSRCVSYGKEAVNYITALSRCQAKGEELNRSPDMYRAFNPESVLYFNKLIAEFILNQENLPSGAMGWVGGTIGADDCVALILDSQSDTVQTVSWDCSAELPLYICQRNVDRPGASELQLTYELSEKPANGVYEEDIPSTSDRQISIPLEILNQTQQYQIGPGFLLKCQYQASLVPEIQNMTIVKGGFIVAGIPQTPKFGTALTAAYPMRLARQAGRGRLATLSMSVPDPENYFIWGNDPVRMLTDYYWCEVNDLRTGKTQRSDRIFLRITGQHVYSASMVLRTSYQERSDLVLYSLSGHDKSAEFTLLESKMANATLYSYRWLRFQHDFTDENSTWTAADFYVFRKDVTDLQPFKPTNWSMANTETILRNDFKRNLDSNFFWIETLSVRSIDICPDKQVYDPISNRTYRIPDTPLGVSYTSPQTCLSNGLPYVSSSCIGDKLYGARWSRFEPNTGCDFTKETSSSVSNTLKDISLSDINDKTVSETVNKTVKVVKDLGSLEPVDIIYIADIIQKATNTTNIPPETGRQILEIVDNVNQLNGTDLMDSQNIGNATSRIIESVDQLGHKIDLDGEPKLRFVTNSTALEVWDVSKVSNDLIIGLQLRLGGGEPVPVLSTADLISLFESGRLTHTDTDAVIVLPGQFVRLVKDANKNRSVKLAMNVYAGTGLFRGGQLYDSGPGQSDTNTNWTLNSRVISAKMTVDGSTISDLGSNIVTTVFHPFVEIPEASRAQSSTCVFWDLSGAGGRGAWSQEGCRYLKTLQGRDVCVCDHLTNFAVLVDLYGQGRLPQEHQFALTIITVIGLCLSIAGLSITILSFILIPKLRQGRPQQTLFNMALAMLASWVVFLAGFTRVESHGGCVAVAALLHYFILVSFMWMLMEGILQYLMFVRVFGTEYDNYMLKTGLPAWGIPLIPVIVVLAVDTNLYRGGNQYCWMSLTPFYYAFLLPVALVMLANIIIYIMVVGAICRRRNISSNASHSGASNRVIGIRASIACFVVLGLSWVFAFFAVEDARVVFQYLFTITNSIQGFLIFLIFTARDPQVRAFWKAKCRCRCSTKDDKVKDRTHVQGQRSNTGSDEYPLNRSRHSNSSSGDEPRLHRSSRETSSSNLPSPTVPYARGGYGGNGEYRNAYDGAYGHGYGNQGYDGYMGQ